MKKTPTLINKMSFTNSALGREEVDSVNIRDLSTQNLSSTQISINLTNSIVIDLNQYGLTFGSTGKACMITVFDINNPSDFASAMGYFHYGNSLLSIPYGLTSVTQLNGINITLTGSILYGLNYGLKIEYPGTRQLTARILLY